MKTVKSLLLGSAAGFVAFTGAQAADLPMAEPVEYVRVCDTYGSGYFYIPGTETCLRISGYVRWDGQVHFNDDDTDTVTTGGTILDSEDDFRMRSRANLRADARTETEWGTLRSFFEIMGTTAWEGSDAGDGFQVEQAFIQFAGFTIGKAQSFFDFVEYDHIGDLFSDKKVDQVAYTASFGSGFAATIAVEDKGPDNTGAGDYTWPNVVAALRVDQAWGSAQVSAAVQNNAGDLDIYDRDPGTVLLADDIGWAVQAGLFFNLPVANEGSYVFVQGVYTEGAYGYGPILGIGDVDLGLSGADLYDLQVSSDGTNNTLWAVGGGVGIAASEQVFLSAGGLYFEHESAAALDGGDLDVDIEGIQLLAKVTWTPVSQLALSAEFQYIDVEVTDDVGTFDADDSVLWLRAQRSF